MSDEIEIAGIRVPRVDWDATPASIQMLVRILSERLLALEERVNQSSQNSSKPPSTDGSLYTLFLAYSPIWIRPFW